MDGNSFDAHVDREVIGAEDEKCLGAKRSPMRSRWEGVFLFRLSA